MIVLNGIPVGNKCYIVDKTPKIQNESLPVMICPYWENIDGKAKCKYLGIYDQKADELISKQIKACGVHQK
jgi:hypothetical protein